jgi:hypothetical protein
MQRWITFAILLAVVPSCGNPHPARPGPAGVDGTTIREPGTDRREVDWPGLYCTPGEIGGFSGTVLLIKRDWQDDLRYRMTFYSDVISANSIHQSELSGSCLADGDRLYIAKASGYYSDGKPRLLAYIDRYTRQIVNGRTVLMRDDALQAYREQNKLYDYGLLIRVADELAAHADLRDVEHPSVKVLYADPAKPWQDPFVHGPNER